MKYTVRLKYQAEVEIDVLASNADEAEEEAAAQLESRAEGDIIAYDILDTIINDDPDDDYDDDDDDAYDDFYDDPWTEDDDDDDDGDN